MAKDKKTSKAKSTGSAKAPKKAVAKPAKPAVKAKAPAKSAAKPSASSKAKGPAKTSAKATQKTKPDTAPVAVAPTSVDHIDEKTMKKIIGKLNEMRDESLEVVNAQVKADLIRRGETVDVGDDMDQASNERDREFNLIIHQRHLRRLQQIEEAFERIRDGSYGLCEGTDEPINPKRLLIMPLARYSIEYQQQQEKMLGRNPEEAGISYDDNFISDE